MEEKSSISRGIGRKGEAEHLKGDKKRYAKLKDVGVMRQHNTNSAKNSLIHEYLKSSTKESG